MAEQTPPRLPGVPAPERVAEDPLDRPRTEVLEQRRLLQHAVGRRRGELGERRALARSGARIERLELTAPTRCLGSAAALERPLDIALNAGTQSAWPVLVGRDQAVERSGEHQVGPASEPAHPLTP